MLPLKLLKGKMRHLNVTLQITCQDSLRQTGTIQSKNAVYFAQITRF